MSGSCLIADFLLTTNGPRRVVTWPGSRSPKIYKLDARMNRSALVVPVTNLQSVTGHVILCSKNHIDRSRNRILDGERKSEFSNETGLCNLPQAYVWTLSDKTCLCSLHRRMCETLFKRSRSSFCSNESLKHTDTNLQERYHSRMCEVPWGIS